MHWKLWLFFYLMNHYLPAMNCQGCDFTSLYRKDRNLNVKQSDASKVAHSFSLRSCPNAVYYKTQNQELPTQIQNWTVSRSGEFTIHKKPFKYGKVKLGFTIENPLNSSEKQETYLTLNINHELNPTKIFLAVNGSNINPSDDLNSKVQISVEENSEAIDLFIGGYNYDLSDTFQFNFLDSSAYGHADIGRETDSYLYSPNSLISCADIPTHNDKIIKMTNISSQTEYYQQLLYYPCNLSILYPGNELSWWSARLSYKPYHNYYGNDSFKFEIRCSHSLQATVNVQMNILANPCRNGGKCKGSAIDPHCKSLQRTIKFEYFNYTCSCPIGYSGDFCSTPPDSCLSSPCYPPLKCHTEIDGSYRCLCPPNAISCYFPAPWTVSLIVLITSAIIFLITFILIRKSSIKSDTYLQSFNTGVFPLRKQNTSSGSSRSGQRKQYV